MADKEELWELPELPEHFKVTPELKLVAECSWVAPTSLEQAQAENITALCDKNINWDTVTALIRRHGIPVLAHEVLRRNAKDKIPPGILENLRQNNNNARRQALFQTGELLRLHKLFTEKQVEMVPLKGVLLSQLIYGDPGIRYSVDLDILVKPDQVAVAEKILGEEGYYNEYFKYALTAKQKAHIRTHIHHMVFVHINIGLHLELHWSLGPWLPEQVATVWNHTKKMEWHGISINTLDNETLLLVLCDHGARHEWSNLKWLGDVAQLLVSGRITDWELLLSLAHRLDLLRTLAHSALLVHWFYSIPLPSELRVLIQKDKLAITLSEKALPIILMNAKEIASAGKHARSLRIAWKFKRLRPSLPYGKILNTMLVPLIDFKTLPLPAALFWLYYPLRPVLWFWRHYVRGHNQP